MEVRIQSALRAWGSLSRRLEAKGRPEEGCRGRLLEEPNPEASGPSLAGLAADPGGHGFAIRGARSVPIGIRLSEGLILLRGSVGVHQRISPARGFIVGVAGVPG